MIEEIHADLITSQLTLDELVNGRLIKPVYAEIAIKYGITVRKFHIIRKNQLNYYRPKLIEPKEIPTVFDLLNILKDREMKFLEVGEYFGVSDVEAERLLCMADRYKKAGLSNRIYTPKPKKIEIVYIAPIITPEKPKPQRFCSFVNINTFTTCNDPVSGNNSFCDKHISRVRDKTCKYLDDNFNECGKPVLVGKRAPYCERHYRICYES